MRLPDLTLQLIYGRVGWGIVLATLIFALWPRRFALTGRVLAIVTLGMVALQALPGPASPSYWLGLAMQLPSGLLVGLCLSKIYFSMAGTPIRSVMSPRLATFLALAGTVLYLDAMGLISMGIYYWGFGPKAAPLLAMLMTVASAVAIARGKVQPQASALLVAMFGFTILRLPTGNIWDALLDPLLWGWALVALARRGWRRATLPASAPAI